MHFNDMFGALRTLFSNIMNGNALHSSSLGIDFRLIGATFDLAVTSEVMMIPATQWLRCELLQHMLARRHQHVVSGLVNSMD